MVGDIGCQVRVLSILLLNDPVLLIPKLGGPKPLCLFLFKDEILRL